MRVRHLLSVFVSAMLVVGAAWAGIGLAPVGGLSDGSTAALSAGLPVELTEAAVGTGAELGADEAFVGASKVSIEPAPDPEQGQVWKTAGCATVSNPQASAAHVADFSGGPWPEDPDCIYMGGYGIGPTNPVRVWDDQYGLWSVRHRQGARRGVQLR